MNSTEANKQSWCDFNGFTKMDESIVWINNKLCKQAKTIPDGSMNSMIIFHEPMGGLFYGNYTLGKMISGVRWWSVVWNDDQWCKMMISGVRWSDNRGFLKGHFPNPNLVIF